MSIEDLEAQGEDGAMILLTEEGKQHRAKLLQFHDNQRQIDRYIDRQIKDKGTTFY